MTTPHYIDTAVVAKLIRKILKSAFPGHTFRVRSSRYAGGSSIDIHWIDGPTTAAVDALVKGLQGAHFDSSQDLKTYNGPMVIAGARVSMGAHYIFTVRKTSRTFLEFCMGEICRLYGCEPAEIVDSTYEPGTASLRDRGSLNVGGGYQSLGDLVYRLECKTSAIGGTFVYDREDGPAPFDVTDKIPAEIAKANLEAAFRAVCPEIAAAAALAPVIEEPEIVEPEPAFVADSETIESENGRAATMVDEPTVPNNVLWFPGCVNVSCAAPLIPASPLRESRPSSRGVRRPADAAAALLLLQVAADRIARLDTDTILLQLSSAERGLEIRIPEL